MAETFAGLPSWAWGAIAAGGTAAANIYASNKQQKSNERMTAEEIALRNKQLALDESQLNPFRQQAAQALTASGLDRLERGSYTPVSIAVPSKYAAYVPKVSGGYSYEKSPELISAAGQLKRDVLAGHTAPTMTDPNNAGRTAVLNTLDGAAGSPGGAVPRDAPSLTDGVNDLTMSYDRRGGGTGGVLSGAATGASLGKNFGGWYGAAAGAVGGAVVGAMRKHAKSAPSDFRVDDAVSILRAAYEKYQGRQPAPEEISRLLAGQGWQPGDRWVGEQGLTALVTSIAQQAA